jgi:light-regulated signal transduction histidine kinase (bacteriophytochrome)
MVKDVLAYSQIGASKQSFRPVNLSLLLDSVLERVLVLVQESGVAVTRDELPTVMADKAQIAQLLQNLITNAILYRSETAPAIHFSAKAEGHQWVVSVRDNGIGIDPAYHLKMFEMFQRLPSGAGSSGAGVGLAICKRVIDRHSGRLWVESSPGNGATFLFTLPSIHSAAGETEHQDSTELPSAA